MFFRQSSFQQNNKTRVKTFHNGSINDLWKTEPLKLMFSWFKPYKNDHHEHYFPTFLSSFRKSFMKNFGIIPTIVLFYCWIRTLQKVIWKYEDLYYFLYSLSVFNFLYWRDYRIVKKSLKKSPEATFWQSIKVVSKLLLSNEGNIWWVCELLGRDPSLVKH